MGEDELSLAVGRLQGEVSAIHADVCELRKDMKIMRDALAETRGAWKMLIAIGAVSGAVGAAVGKLAAWIGLLLPK